MRRYGKWRKQTKRFKVKLFPYRYFYENGYRRIESQARVGLTNRRWDSL